MDTRITIRGHVPLVARMLDNRLAAPPADSSQSSLSSGGQVVNMALKCGFWIALAYTTVRLLQTFSGSTEAFRLLCIAVGVVAVGVLVSSAAHIVSVKEEE